MLGRYFSLIKFSHTLFALPFALVGLTLGLRTQIPEGTSIWIVLTKGELIRLDMSKLIYVVLCMVFARSAAMAFNRYADRAFDSLNERTANREIPAGKIKPFWALFFVILNSLAFIVSAWFINKLCFYLSPVALAVILGYSYTKRFTYWCHFVLGLGLALAPIGAYIAITESFELNIIVLGIGVLTWVSGFDIVYALQDMDFDRKNSLHSVPVWIGKEYALYISTFLHCVTAFCLLFFGWMVGGGWFYFAGALIFTALLYTQHRLIKPNDLSKINLAFFTTNGIASIVFGILAIIDLSYYPMWFEL